MDKKSLCSQARIFLWKREKYFPPFSKPRQVGMQAEVLVAAEDCLHPSPTPRLCKKLRNPQTVKNTIS